MLRETDLQSTETPELLLGRGPGRVAIVSDSLPERNGVGAYYQDLLAQLRAQSVPCEVLCPSGTTRDYLKFPLPGDPTQRIWIPSPGRFRKVMRSHRPETVVVATPGPYGLLGAWWARRLGARLIVGFHTNYSGVTDLYSNPILRSFSRLWFGWADKILFRYADLVLANSDQMVNLAKEMGAKKVDLMGTLVPVSSLEAPVAPLSGDLSRVLFAGRLAPEKNIQSFVDAARELPAIDFVIAGDGPLKDQIAKQADAIPNLEYLGWVSRKQLLKQMDRADMLVLPSHVESFGTVALEAMARERLALVSESCGIVHWPNLSKHVYRIGTRQTVSDAIRDVAALSEASRRKRATQSRQAARNLNRLSLQHWFKQLSSQV